jgi:hypothetical protein
VITYQVFNDRKYSKFNFWKVKDDKDLIVHPWDDKSLREAFESAKIPLPEIDAAGVYTLSGSTAMNGYLRDGKFPSWFQKRADYYMDKIDKLKSLINKVSLDENITVMRGLGPKESKIIKKAIASHKYTVDNPGFLSTTLDKSIAHQFAKERDTMDILVLNVPKSKGTGALIESVSYYKEEREFLINAGKKYQLFGMTTIGDYTYYLANLIL